MLNISNRFGIDSLKEKCYQELANDEFEQLNYHRSDLLDCDADLFVEILQQHQKYVKRRVIKGFSQTVIKKFIREYCEYNSVEID